MKTHSNAESTADVQKLTQLHFSFAPSRILTVGLQFRVFSHIAAGHTTAAAIAKAAGASERGMRMLLDALAGLELLIKKDGHYMLTPVAERYLVRESPDYAGYIMESDSLWEAWSRLADCVRTGKPCQAVNQQQRAEEFFPVLVRGLHVTNREPARRLALALAGDHSHGGQIRVVDVACGSGVWGIAVAETHPHAQLTAQDFPKVLELTRQYLRQHGVEDRYDLLPGDLKEVDFGENRYDVALLGNIVHSEGERASRQLFKRLARALRAGGRIAIMDMLPSDDRSGPPFPLFFALNMLVNTDAGDTYTLAEYTDWLKDAGFATVETADIGSHSPAIIATKN